MPRFDPWPGEFSIEEWDPDFRQRVSADGKTYGNVQEEPVRQWAAAQLVKNFCVPQRQIKFEEPVKYQHERKSARQRAKGFRDIVVYDDRYNGVHDRRGADAGGRGKLGQLEQPL